MGLGLHETLRDRSLLEITLIPFKDMPSPIHVGYGGVEVIKAIVRFPVDGRLMPIIPSDSIKGIMRAEATRMAKELSWVGDVAISVNAHTRKDLHEVGDDQDFKSRALDFVSRNFTEIQRAEVEDKAVEIYASSLCPICRLFGSRYLAGKLLMTDAVPLNVPRVLTYTSTAVNRRTRTIGEQRLFTTEYIEPSPELAFRFTIIVDNVKDYREAPLLALLLELFLRLGLMVGGAKSRGYGLLKVDEEKSYVKYAAFSAEQMGVEQRLENVRRLLMKEGHYVKLSLYEYVSLLRGKHMLPL
ncbi:MAG: RAMP superfamily CRISPR-associated protein [Nitrososphaerota archaeon]